jgi:hypothetical protein
LTLPVTPRRQGQLGLLKAGAAFWGLACFSIATLPAADNAAFRPKPATEYANAQKTSGLVVAVQAYSSEEQTKLPFGKLNPNKYGVLPVLLLMSNQSDKALRLEKMTIKYVTKDKQDIEAVPASEVKYLNAPGRPRTGPSPLPPIPGLRGGRKNPLEALEIESRAFAAKILPPGDSAYGFVYFHVSHRPGSLIYLTGVEEAGTGKELFFVEVPLDTAR